METYLATCWNCLSEFESLNALWCSHDPKNPTKLCPFCLRCFCDANEQYKQEFWRHAPARLKEELQTLSKSRDRLGDILIRMKKLTTPQLLEALIEQKNTDKRLGEILTERRLVKPEDIATALKTQGVSPLTDTLGVAYSSSPVWEHSEPGAIIQYVLSLAARRSASDVHLEPTEDAISLKYRIDGFYFRVDPIPKRFQEALTKKIFEVFRLDPESERKPQTSRTTGRLANVDYDFVAQTLPTSYGVSAHIKLINRASFIKDFATLGLEIEDRVRLMEELRASSGLILVSGPVFNGAVTTAYSMMDCLIQGQRDVVSLESPVHLPLEGARQIEVNPDGTGLRMSDALRSVMAVRPDAVVLFSMPDTATALLAANLAASILVVAVLPAQSCAQAVQACIAGGVPPHLLASCLSAVTCQRLIRKICRICRQTVEAPAAQTLARHGLSTEEAATLKFFKGKGCPSCNKIGYRGRQAVFEVMGATGEVKGGLLSGLSGAEIQAIAVKGGMRPLREQVLQLVREGVTTFDEFQRLRLN